MDGIPFRRVERSLAGSRKPSTSSAISARMGRIRQKGTAPELLVRKACSELGLHYRTRNRDLPGSPDLANRTHRWALFVNGCYWHHHKGCPKATTPKSNAEFWLAKFARNQQRDIAARHALRRFGYYVVTVWQCEAEVASKLAHRLRKLANQRGEAAQARRIQKWKKRNP